MTADLDSAGRFIAVLRERLQASRLASPEAAWEADAVRARLPAGDAASCPSQTMPAEPGSVVGWLDAALAAAQAGPEAALASAVRGLQGRLRWTFGYAPDPRWPALAASVGFADIVGKSSLVPAPDIVVGLTLQAPRTYYPLHAHPAIELYLVLSGTAEWTAGADKADRPPGALILHPSGLPHAMRTREAPLLALFTWRGDIASPSIFVE
ncbi:dimethylsulfonioproprionate lyase family protein [Labrys wisconsinensis]|uniref:Mannose-6-phosphate isomerase-like protein (Cupin superfamily) n=1 Tax=Labrys wisconsinensis TaxID=425677 RepID=A0ABU0JFC6_9HYPH|nr:dimethylsulfonioproprionate lyase family protein [Labrys wisconsinensis]MDQ0471827.1 mannose-6-phosphate isomerase-like protein (cupin superfamily) [Labrys wisconsinensis]